MTSFIIIVIAMGAAYTIGRMHGRDIEAKEQADLAEYDDEPVQWGGRTFEDGDPRAY